MTLLHVRPWADPHADSGFPADSLYCERFWLPVLGPTAYLLQREVGRRLRVEPAGFVVDVGDLAAALGVSASPNGALRKAMRRLERFGLVRCRVDQADDVLECRRTVPWAGTRHVAALPARRRREHDLLRSRLYARSA